MLHFGALLIQPILARPTDRLVDLTDFWSRSVSSSSRSVRSISSSSRSGTSSRFAAASSRSVRSGRSAPGLEPAPGLLLPAPGRSGWSAPDPGLVPAPGLLPAPGQSGWSVKFLKLRPIFAPFLHLITKNVLKKRAD